MHMTKIVLIDTFQISSSPFGAKVSTSPSSLLLVQSVIDYPDEQTETQ